MKKTLLLIATIGLISFGCETKHNHSGESKSNKSSSGSDAEIEQLIQKMTIEEKVGQMTQLNIDVISKGEIYNLSEPHEIVDEKLKKAIMEYHVGSILNCGGHTYTRDHWREIIGKIQDYAVNQHRLKIPVIYGIDAIHGANYTVGATLFPQQIGQAGSWNPELVKDAMAVCARDVRSCGISWNFSPVLDLGRNPLWSRYFETFGEDVYLAKTMTDGAILGYQGEDPSQPNKVAACMKHFLGYSMPLTGKDRTPAWIPERQLREYFLPTFQRAIALDAKTLMINSGEINGIPVHANPDILTKLLRDELGFEGIAVTDWEDVIKLHREHKVAPTLKEAVRLAVVAGIDMSMTPNDYSFNDLLIELVKEGSITEDRLDLSVRRILTVKKELGLFEQAIYDLSNYPKEQQTAEDAQLALDLANESMTLLKNDNNNLPIGKDQKIFLTGPAANSLNILNGAWTHTWQGVEALYNTKGKLTVYEALQQEFENVTYAEGSSLFEEKSYQEALNKARKADRVVICIGEKPATEKPGDIEDLALPKAQKKLVKELAKAGKPITLVLVEHRPRIIREIEPLCDGILMAYLPGDEGGRSIAQTLSGKNNPSGKLPYTYHRYSGSLISYDHKFMETFDISFGHNAFKPQWEFGHGLSYSSFKYSEVTIDKDTIGVDDTLKVTVTVANESDMPGKEVVQVFVRDDFASIAPSVKRLRGYGKVLLNGGESKKVVLPIPVKDLAFINKDNQWDVEEGMFTVMVKDKNIPFYVQK